MFGHIPPRPKEEKPKHCRDEQIGKTKAPLCTKQSWRATELLANQCRNCGRPLSAEVFGPDSPIGGPSDA